MIVLLALWSFLEIYKSFGGSRKSSVNFRKSCEKVAAYNRVIVRNTILRMVTLLEIVLKDIGAIKQDKRLFIR